MSNYYSQPHHVADEVSRWTNLGVTLSKDLDDAIEVFETLRYVEVGYRPVFDLASVTPDNAESRIREYADELVLSASNSGQSALDRAKKDAVDAAARRVNTLARQAVPSIIEQLSSDFGKHADAYSEAVLRLPVDLTAETLLAAGADAVTGYGSAKEEAGYLAKITGWVRSTNDLPGARSDNENVLNILQPSSCFELVKLDEAASTPADAVLSALNPVWVAAVRLGVPFGINTPREAVSLRRELESAAKLARKQTPQGVAYLPSA